MVGMVVTISPNLSLYNIVVLPAASRPTIRIRISFLAKSRLKSLVNDSPILYLTYLVTKGGVRNPSNVKKNYISKFVTIFSEQKE